MSRRKWNISHIDKEKAAQIAEKFNIDAFTALLLVSRNMISDEQITAFLDNNSELLNPFEITDMQKAVDRINKAIFEFERIAVFGDYDADGVTATAVLYSYLEAQGADVFYYIPERISEGYGLNKKTVEKLHQCGAKLIITVDNGISANDEVEYARKFGIDVVVTDHHLSGKKLPNAVAVVDPHREDCTSKFKDYSGVGVAYMLVSAIEGENPSTLLPHFADLVAIGTIADVVPLKGENRKLVKKGLRLINQRERLGIEAIAPLLGLGEKPISSANISFGIAPRINAAGRMGNANRALSLLICEEAESAAEIASEINELNDKRHEAEADILKIVEQQLKDCPKRCFDRVLVVDGEGWHEGVIGIVAARLVEKYSRPCIVISSSGEISKGSGRSIDGFSLFDALNAVKDKLEILGGHSLAAGFTIKTKNIAEFRESINTYAKNFEMPYPKLDVDCKLNPKFINVDILDSISALEPFGEGNRVPAFGLFEMVIDSISAVGDKKQHIKMHMHKYGKEGTISVMKFGTCPSDFAYKAGDIVDIVVGIERNIFMGETRVTILLKDIRFTGTDDDEMINGIKIFEKIIRREQLTAEEAVYALPSRELSAEIYRFIKANGNWRYTTEVLWQRVKHPENNYSRTAVAVEVFKELGVLAVNDSGHIIIPDSVKKNDLDNSDIRKYITNNCSK
ncbi:MAG: single-stranded-DNA-specific exonuclease RecJ [Oscillospiraceae bacterium]